jgi:hypothetical protein
MPDGTPISPGDPICSIYELSQRAKYHWCAVPCLVLLPKMQAQIRSATITGLVTDPTGAVIPDAAVIVTETATSVSYSSKSDSKGLYTIPYAAGLQILSQYPLPNATPIDPCSTNNYVTSVENHAGALGGRTSGFTNYSGFDTAPATQGLFAQSGAAPNVTPGTWSNLTPYGQFNNKEHQINQVVSTKLTYNLCAFSAPAVTTPNGTILVDEYHYGNVNQNNGNLRRHSRVNFDLSLRRTFNSPSVSSPTLLRR